MEYMRLIKVKVTPDSRKDEVRLRKEGSFEVTTRASAERGEANDAVIALLGKELGIPSEKFRIIKGHRSHSKIIEIWQ